MRLERGGRGSGVEGQVLAWCALAAAAFFFAGCSARESHEGAPRAAAEQSAKKKFQCPMHPTYTSDRPGLCPICGMSLVEIEDDHAKHDGAAVHGRTTVKIPSERRQQIGLATVEVKKERLTRTIRTNGTLEYDETRLTRVNPRIGGWIQDLYVNATGQRVEKGQALFKLYSPDLLVTEKEYLNALAAGSAELIGSARRRLELWGVSDGQIGELEKARRPSDTLDLLAPAAGYVIEKNVIAGQSFMPGATLYEIADLSHLWVHAFVYEYELRHIVTGMPATVEVTAFPNTLFDAKVAFIYPYADEVSRTLTVRLELDNPKLELKPDMWANVEFDVDLGEALTVPASAVIDTGKRFVAFVDKGEGLLEPRELKIGGRTDDAFQVREGLAEGERVVARALFLIDAESQLKAAVAGMSADGGGH
jgi:membrane fusion protein, copper/silver efflux system